MDDLQIQIVLTYKVPEKDLTLNCLLRGPECDWGEIMRTTQGMILPALKEKRLWRTSDSCGTAINQELGRSRPRSG